MARDLEDSARNCLSDVIYDVETLDLDKLREDAQEAAWSAADNACIYYSHCLDIIRDYESDSRADPECLDDSKTYKASEWQEAVQAYAFAIAYSVIQAEVSELLGKVEESAESLVDVVNELLSDDSIDASDLRVSLSCPHGWASHDLENEDGVHLWTSRQLDGCNAVAVDAGPFWLSYTWTPESDESQEDSGS